MKQRKIKLTQNKKVNFQNYFFIKPSPWGRIWVGLFVSILIACGGNNAADKKTELENLKKQQAEIAEQIKKMEAEMSSGKTNEVDNQKEKLVAVIPIISQQFKHYIEIQGRVDADENVSVSPKMPGVVMNILVKEGDKVSKEQTLAELDNKMIYQNLEEVKTSYEFAKTVFEKQKRLWEQKIGTEIQFLTAKNNKESLEKRLAALQEQYEMTKIKSPINGTVDAVIPKVGEAVMPGLPSFKVVNFSNFKVKARVPENYIGKMKINDLVEIHFPDVDKKFSAPISFVGRVIDANSRTFDIEIKMNTNDFEVNPNMLAILKINDFTEEKALVVPINTIQRSENESYVFIANAENGKQVAKKIMVKQGMYYGSQVHILDGLKEGDKLISIGYQDLTNGQAIKY